MNALRVSALPARILAVFVVLAFLLAACGGGGAATDQPAPPVPGTTITEPAAGEVTEAVVPEAATEAVTEAVPEAATEAVTEAATEATGGGTASGEIRVAVVRGAMLETMNKLVDKFKQENPGAAVTVEEEPEGGAFEALIAAGNQPDLITVSFGPQIGRLAAQEAVVPLEDMPGAAELFARLEPATVQELYGHNYYVPIGADVTLMIYNKQLFEEAGLDPEAPPKTWDEFLAAIEKIQALPPRENGDKVYGTVFWNDALTWGGWYWNMLQPIYLNANGGQCQLLNRLATDIVFNQPECKLAEFYDFVRKAQEFAPPTMEKNFFSRSIGTWLQYGYSWEPNLKEAAGEPMVIGKDVGVAPVPVPNEGDKSYTTYGGRALMVLKTTPERQNLAWQFVQFLMQEENNLTFIKELGYLPTITSLKDDPYFQEPARQPFVQALENGVLPEQIGAADDVAVELLGVYQKTVVEKTVDPTQAVEEAAKNAQAKLQQ
jgi:multiple sugar transport system substrate-binding protein